MRPSRRFAWVMNNLILLIIAILLMACNEIVSSEEKIEELPDNSATKLLLERSNEENLNIVRPEVNNLDQLRGFRGLKINACLDDLNMEGWELNKDQFLLSNKIQEFRKSIDLEFVKGDSLYDITLIFWRDTLKEITISDWSTPYTTIKSGYYSWHKPLALDKIKGVYGNGTLSTSRDTDFSFSSLTDLLTKPDPPGIHSARRTYGENYEWISQNYSLYSSFESVYVRNNDVSPNADRFIIEDIRLYLNFHENATSEKVREITSEAFRINMEKDKEEKKSYDEEHRKEKTLQNIESF